MARLLSGTLSSVISAHLHHIDHLMNENHKNVLLRSAISKLQIRQRTKHQGRHFAILRWVFWLITYLGQSMQLVPSELVVGILQY